MINNKKNITGKKIGTGNIKKNVYFRLQKIKKKLLFYTLNVHDFEDKRLKKTGIY